MSRQYAIGEEDDGANMSVSQQCYAIPENEGDLTDEYIVNLIFSSSSTPQSFDYHPLKLYEQLQDVVNMLPIDATHGHGESLAKESHIVPYHGEPSLMPSNSNASPQLGSPSFMPVSMSPASAGAYSEPSLGTLENVRYVDMALAVPENSEAPENFLSVAPSIPSTLPMAAGPSGEVSTDMKDPPKKKRGRKPKSLAEKANSPSASLRKIKRLKVYEIKHPFNDKEKERKRLNAVNAKKHRELQKELKKLMEKQIADVTIERDIYKQEIKEKQRKISQLTRQLEAVKRHCGVNPFPEEPQPQN